MSTIRLKVVRRVEASDDFVTLYFKKSLFSIIRYRSGQYITVVVTIDGQKYERPYSLSSALGIDKLLSITVKKQDGGVVSNYLIENLKEGSIVKALKPKGDFCVIPSSVKQRHFILIGGGSGISPLFSIAKTILKKEPRSIVSLVYYSLNVESIIFKTELDSLVEEYAERFKIIYSIKEASEKWEGQVGILMPSQLLKILYLLGKPFEMKSEYYVCGPKGLVEVVDKGLSLSNVLPEQIFKEAFCSASGENIPVVKGLDFQSRTIKLKFPGVVYGIRVHENTSILDSALHNKLQFPHMCSNGFCGTCKCKLENGDVKMIGEPNLSQLDKDNGYVLACLSYPSSDGVVLNLIDK